MKEVWIEDLGLGAMEVVLYYCVFFSVLMWILGDIYEGSELLGGSKRTKVICLEVINTCVKHKGWLILQS